MKIVSLFCFGYGLRNLDPDVFEMLMRHVTGAHSASAMRDFHLSLNLEQTAVLLLNHSDQYLDNSPPSPPLTQQQSIDNKLGLMLG